MGACVMKVPLYVCVYVPEFPAQVLLRLRPELAKTAVAILSGEPPLEEVCSANALAFRLGVTLGMTRSELDNFTGLSLLKRAAGEERSARNALLEASGVFTPRIEIQPSVGSTFIMVLDMTGTTRIFGLPEKALGRIVQVFSALSFYVQIAASANLYAATCMAPAARTRPLLIPAGQEAEMLSTLPLAALNLTAQQSETLELWGLRRVGELAALPEVDLISRLGQQGKRLRQLARGEYSHLMVPEEPVFTLEELISFDAPVEILDSLLFVLGPMLDQLLARAQNHAFALASVTVKLGLDGGGEHERSVKPALPVLQREILLKLLQLDLQLHPPSAGVVSLHIHAEPGERSKVQLGLFAPQLPEPLRLDVTLARIAALVGEERVGRATLKDTHHPDSFTIGRFVVPQGTKKSEQARHSVALRRCRPPLRLSVQQKDRRLVAFFLHGKRFAVHETYGPWRKSGEWWSQQIWSHEEWDVLAKTQTEDTLLCVITHDLLHHHWQLDALYD